MALMIDMPCDCEVVFSTNPCRVLNHCDSLFMALMVDMLCDCEVVFSTNPCRVVNHCNSLSLASAGISPFNPVSFTR